ALAILTEFRQVHNQSTLEDAITLYREALLSIPKSHSMHWRVLWELSEGLLIQYWHTGDVAQVEEAISCLQQAQETKPNRLPSLRAALLAAYKAPAPRGHQPEYTRRAVFLFQRMAENDNKGLALVSESLEFRKQFERSQNVQHFEKFVRTLEEAESLLSWGHRGRDALLGILPNSLWQFSEINGNAMDLQTAIALFREYLALGNTQDPRYGPALGSLAGALYKQFILQGNQEDLDETVELCKKATIFVAAPHPLLLSNLAMSLKARFKQRGDPNAPVTST
ncbi:hypothetical protein GGX14DRAFT_379045, partial [Mycena pura]